MNCEQHKSSDEMSQNRRFWMVLGAGAPRQRHYSRTSARNEAARLARLHPGQPFTVLASEATVQRQDLSWIDHVTESYDHAGKCQCPG